MSPKHSSTAEAISRRRSLKEGAPFLFPETTLKIEDFHSQTWKRLSQHVDERIDELRKLNDGPHDPVQTALIRGGIKELKKILALAEDVSAREAVSPDELSGADNPVQ